MGRFVDITGERFGRLTVIRLYRKGSGKPCRQPEWLCKCDCGNEVIVRRGNLHTGNTKGCGCLRYENQGAWKPNENRCWNSWRAMKQRCYNKSNNRYKYYGGRGIVICDEWKNDFNKFQDWSVKHGYADNLTIDRIDPDGNYEPSNCRWVTPFEQASNKRRHKND